MKFKIKQTKIFMFLLSFISLLVLIYFTFFNSNPDLCPRLIPSYILLIYLILLILIIVPLTYLFISKQLESRFNKNLEVLSKIVNQEKYVKNENLNATKIILKLLSSNEKKTFKLLIDNKGTILQSKINYLDGMNKLKTHRTIKDLIKKNIVYVESHGKTNKVYLTKAIKELMM
jgi:hypothetical protein